ncbi:MAG: hypothetical protein HRU15_03430 [Planctomycetes bacterium]|nr:hypothetical protein [Planctomycetota bacterium]
MIVFNRILLLALIFTQCLAASVVDDIVTEIRNLNKQLPQLSNGGVGGSEFNIAIGDLFSCGGEFDGLIMDHGKAGIGLIMDACVKQQRHFDIPSKYLPMVWISPVLGILRNPEATSVISSHV